MEKQRPAEIFIREDQGSNWGSSHEGRRLPPWLFQHEDLIYALEQAEPVDPAVLTNTINHLHFMGGSLLVRLTHPRYSESVLMGAYPEPCLGKELVCRWTDEAQTIFSLNRYQFQHLVIDDGQSMILVPIEVMEMEEGSFKIRLPGRSFAVGKRRGRRHPCMGVGADLNQNGFLAAGRLVDYNPFGFCIRVEPRSTDSFHWFNGKAPAMVQLRRGRQVLFSGPCACVRQRDLGEKREMVLKPVQDEINRYEKKQIRNPRQHLVPSPSLVFEHPFLNRRVQMEICDISTSGFSVTEKGEEGMLMQGMIIPELQVHFAGAMGIDCSAQVVYRRHESEDRVRCGLAILDMDINTYSRLTHILSNALDPNAYVSSEVDMGALWEFFFDTGFIYPTKYRLIQPHRERFKETYEKLYQQNPEIAKHFTHQRNGRIYGHIAMVRAYEKTWMIHHHAARVVDSKRAGFIVLKQIMHYLNDMHRLPSAKIDYVMSYFRPENKFPDRVFGGFARALEDRQGCSMDSFAYLPYTSLSLGADLPEGWSLRECGAEELWELNRCYSHHSGGLLLKAMDLGQDKIGEDSIEQTYERLGFFRRRSAFALMCQDELQAVLIVDQSDLGFNLSELLNGIKIMVTSPETLPWNILSTAIAKLTHLYSMERIPVLFYPVDYVKARRIPYEKCYHCWVLNVRHGDAYMEYMQKRFRISYQ
jgi:hypothetical protein